MAASQRNFCISSLTKRSHGQLSRILLAGAALACSTGLGTVPVCAEEVGKTPAPTTEDLPGDAAPEVQLPSKVHVAVETGEKPLLDGVESPPPTLAEGEILPPLDPLSLPTDPVLLPEEQNTDASTTSRAPEPILPALEDEEGEGFDADLFEDLLEPPEQPERNPDVDLNTEWGSHSWGGSRLSPYSYSIRGTELLTPGMGPPTLNEGFRFGLGIQANYDSNIRLLERNEKDDFFLLISPGMEYRSGPPEGVPGIVTFRYEPIFRRHLNDTSLNTVDQSAVLDISFQGHRSSFRAEAEYGKFAESNNEALSVADTKSYSFLVEGTYRVSDRLSANALWVHTVRDVDPVGLGSNDSEVSSLELSFGWAATPQLTIGPAIRHAEADSDNRGKTETIGATFFATYRPVSIDNLQISVEGGYEDRDRTGDDGSNFTGGVRINYRLDQELRLRASVEYQTISELSGVDFSGSAGGDERLTARLSAHYTPDQKLWSAKMGAAIRSRPSSGAISGQSANTSSIEAELIRRIGVSSLSFGAELDLLEYSGGAVNREDDTTISTFLRYGRPILGDQASFNTTVRLSENSGLRDWSRVQVATGLQFSF